MIILCLIFYFCQTISARNNLACVNERTCETNADKLGFLLLGDIGGLPVYPYRSYAQSRVAESMVKLAKNKNMSFVVNVGDNFYFNGVTDVMDPRFETSFENIYSDPSLNLPWYTIAGNHDHNGNVSAQISYTNHSHKWTFPDLYYKFSYKFGSSRTKTTVEFIMLDTIVLCGNTIDVQGSSLIDWIFAKHKDPDGSDDKEAARRQLEWVEQQLARSKADFLFVVGHYPIYSISEHGPTKCLIENLDPLLRKYNVTAYFAGHDHNLQHIRIVEPAKNGTRPSIMNYIVSGAGSRSDRSARHTKSVPEHSLLFRYPSGWNPFSQIGFSNGGFIYGRMKKERAEFTFYNGKLEGKYFMTLWPRNL